MVTLTPIELAGDSPRLRHFAHLALAPLVAAPRIIVQGCPGGVSVRVELPVVDTRDGGRWWTGGHWLVSAEELEAEGPAAAERCVRAAWLDALAHEVDECLCGEDGRPVRDPHGEPVRPVVGGEEAA